LAPEISLLIECLEGQIVTWRRAALSRCFLTGVCVIAGVGCVCYAFSYSAPDSQLYKWGLSLLGGCFVSLMKFPINDIVDYLNSINRDRYFIKALASYQGKKCPRNLIDRAHEVIKGKG